MPQHSCFCSETHRNRLGTTFHIFSSKRNNQQGFSCDQRRSFALLAVTSSKLFSSSSNKRKCESEKQNGGRHRLALIQFNVAAFGETTLKIEHDILRHFKLVRFHVAVMKTSPYHCCKQ